MKRAARFLVLALAIGVGAGCGNNDQNAPVVSQPQGYGGQQQYQGQGQEPQQYQQQAAPGQPVIVNQAPAASNSGVSDMLLGGMMGYMLGNSGNSGSRERVVERHYETRTAEPTRSYTQQTAPKAAPVTASKSTYSGWSSSKPAAAPAKKSYSGWGSPSTSAVKSSAPARKSYSGFSSTRSSSRR